MEDESAASSVLRLLTISVLPKKAQLPILSLAVPLLEREELPPLFSVKDTTRLMVHLQVIVDSIAKVVLSARPGNIKAYAHEWVGRASTCVRLTREMAVSQQRMSSKCYGCLVQEVLAWQDEETKGAQAKHQDMSAVRLALARNLARAQIAAGCADMAAE